MAQDDEAAREFLLSGSRGEASTRVSEFSPEVVVLAGIYDRIGAVFNAVVSLGGGKAGDLPPFPRPQVAADRVHVELAHERHRRIVAQLLPGVSDGVPG